MPKCQFVVDKPLASRLLHFTGLAVVCWALLLPLQLNHTGTEQLLVPPGASCRLGHLVTAFSAEVDLGRWTGH